MQQIVKVGPSGSPDSGTWASVTPRRMGTRYTARAGALLRATTGDVAALRGKVERLSYALKNAVVPDERIRRLERLKRFGLIDQIPTRVQLIAGSVDMFRTFIVPAADDYYQQQEFSTGFHALLRALDDPASMVDPTGLASHTDAIIGHLMQVVHAEPIYDLQLLLAVDDDPWAGIDRLELQLQEMLWGCHPRARSIQAIVEDPDYHARLLRLVRKFRENPAATPQIRRDNVVLDPRFSALAEIFGSLPSTMRYFCALPTAPRKAALHIMRGVDPLTRSLDVVSGSAEVDDA